MKIEHTPEHNIARLEFIESRFYPTADSFTEAKRKDERDASMNAQFREKRAYAAQRVNQILDDYLDLQALVELATPLEPVDSAI